jgi:hypothetical protein
LAIHGSQNTFTTIFARINIHLLVADAASEPEASEQVSSSEFVLGSESKIYFRFADQNALLLTDQNALYA